MMQVVSEFHQGFTAAGLALHQVRDPSFKATLVHMNVEYTFVYAMFDIQYIILYIEHCIHCTHTMYTYNAVSLLVHRASVQFGNAICVLS